MIRDHFPPHRPVLYLDLDGVMADFDGYFPELFGFDHRASGDDEMWGAIDHYGTFFRDLPPCDGALDFFQQVRHLSPLILTAVPFDPMKFEDIASQKRAWVREHLGLNVPVIFSPGGKNKQFYMHREGDILIDDFPRNIERWNAAGGRGIWHTGDFAATKALLDHHLSEL